jgi:hypothetical protein
MTLQSRKSLFIISILMKRIFEEYGGLNYIVCMSFCHEEISAFFFIFQNTKCKPANSAEIPNPVNTQKKKDFQPGISMMAH